MNGKTRPAYAIGLSPGELAKEYGCSQASVHAWVKKAGTLKSLPEAGKVVKIVHRQAHQVHAAMALSVSERDELLRLRKDNKRLQTEQDILANSLA